MCFNYNISIRKLLIQFDYTSMKFIRLILFPVLPIYYLVTWLRNKLYDLGIKKSISYNFPVICVGNLSVGGTGKTPLIEYLITFLKDDFKVATLSRGYKRKTKGFQLANEKSTFETIGDEPIQFYNKFKQAIIVSVDSNRKHGINKLRNTENIPDVILLDDAFQHRKVKAGLNIVLTTYSNPFYNDWVLPTGNLREPKSGIKRAHIIIVTKCPKNLSDAKKKDFINNIKPKSNQQLFFSSIMYSEKIISEKTTKSIDDLKAFTLITGIANHKPLVDFLTAKNLTFEHLRFKDHHDFTEKDIEEFNQRKLLITTEKDYMRLKQHQSLQEKLFYIPITVAIGESSKFNGIIKQFMER